MGQPNLSRAIRELEESLGITIFCRTSKGITITDEGEQLLQHAQRIIQQVDELEQAYRTGGPKRQLFSVSAPRASYILRAPASLCEEEDIHELSTYLGATAKAGGFYGAP